MIQERNWDFSDTNLQTEPVHVQPMTSNIDCGRQLKQQHPFRVKMAQDHDNAEQSTAIRQHVQHCSKTRSYISSS